MGVPSRKKRRAPAESWPALAGRVRPYLAACAWQSAHDLLWPALEAQWDSPLPPKGLECLALALNACARLDHAEHLKAGAAWLQRIQPPNAILPPETHALCALALAQQEVREGRYAEARGRLEAITREEEGVRPGTRARLALLRGRLAAVAGREGDAEREALAAAQHAEHAGSEILAGDSFALLAILARRRGALAEANSLYANAARHSWNAGDLKGHAVTLLNRAWTVGLIGILPHAARLFDEALDQAVALGRGTTALLARLGRGWLALRAGELREARERLLLARRAARLSHLPREEALALEYLAEVHILAGRPARARAALQRGSALAARLAPESDLALELRIREATLELAQGRLRCARNMAEGAIALAGRMRAPWEEAQARRILATACFHLGERGRALEAFRAVHARLLAMGEQIERRLIEAWLDLLESEEDETSGRKRARMETYGGEGTVLRLWLAHPWMGPPAGRAEQPRERLSLAAMDENHRAERGTHPIPSASSCRDDARSALHSVWSSVGLATRSPELIRLLGLLETYAPSRIPVLILGETGTGKDLVAQGLHALSGHPGPLVPVNCAAARKETFVAELFGARRGAYTGAIEHRRGLIEEAEQGTIFFDEIADLEAEAQGFLLRFLDSGEIRRLGETQSRKVETRVIAATCVDLGEKVASGLFRPDLYGRLAGLVVRIPPLRERPEDLEPVVTALWRRHGGREGQEGRVFCAPVLAALRRWHWPGNVRELKHAVERAALFERQHGADDAARGLIQWVHTLTSAAPAPGPVPVPAPPSAEPQRVWGHWDPRRLEEALDAANGRVAEAARMLGLSRSHAYRLYKRLGKVPGRSRGARPAAGGGG